MTGQLWPEIILHVGAHRTGSTRLQLALDENVDVLLQHGIAALTPPRPDKRMEGTIRVLVRRALRRRPIFGRRHRFQQDLRGLVGLAMPKRLILSEEMILGPAFDRDGSGFYPRSQARLQRLVDVLPDAPSTVCLVIRSYDKFLVSVYAMRALFTERMRPFDEIRGAMLDIRAGWPGVVAALRQAFPEASVQILTLEATPLAQQVAALVGSEVPVDLHAVDAMRINAAPTEEAIAAALAGEPGPADEIIARYAGGTRFNPLTSAEKEMLSKRYQADLEALGLTRKATAAT